MADPHRWYRTLGALLRHGVPLPDALDLVAGAVGGDLGRAAAWIGEGVRSGRTLADGMERLLPLFDPLAVSLVAAAERNGTVVEALLDLADPDLVLGPDAAPSEREEALARLDEPAAPDGIPAKARTLLARALEADGPGLRISIGTTGDGVIHALGPEGIAGELEEAGPPVRLMRRYMVRAGIPYWARPPRDGVLEMDLEGEGDPVVLRAHLHRDGELLHLTLETVG